MRQGVYSRKELERLALEAHIRAKCASDHQRELKELEARYLSRINELGEGHRAAQSSRQV